MEEVIKREITTPRVYLESQMLQEKSLADCIYICIFCILIELELYQSLPLPSLFQ